MRSSILLLATFLVTSPVDAQRIEPFSRISLSGAVQQHVGEHQLHPRWSPAEAAEGFITTPFYLGDAEVGALAHRYTPVQDVPAFVAVMPYAGWNIGIRFPRGVKWSAGARLGMYFMNFDEDTFPGVRNEAELTAGAQATVSVDVTRHIGFFGRAAYTRTFTFVHLDMAHVSFGARLTFRSPQWLVGVLQ